MKKAFLLSVAGLTIVSCTAPKNASDSERSFAGNWSEKYSSESSFSLDLKQQGDLLTGYHEAVALHGRRIDAVLPVDGSPSISGHIIDSTTARVTFRSGFSGDGKGVALLVLKGGNLSWTILESTGAHYLPESCMLVR